MVISVGAVGDLGLLFVYGWVSVFVTSGEKAVCQSKFHELK